jgi:hypothetical protein
MIESVLFLKSESLFFSLSEKKSFLELKLGQHFANRQSKAPGASLIWDASPHWRSTNGCH